MNNNRGLNNDVLMSNLQQRIKNYRLQINIQEQGRVVSVGDGIAWISGLPSASMDEVLLFEDGSHATVFALTRNLIGAVLLHQTDNLTAGTIVHQGPKIISIPVSESIVGRIVDPLGIPLDGENPLQADQMQPLDVLSPPIIKRANVHKPLLTGNKIIDTLIPIGKGQRQLIIGDKGTGRSSLALDAVINQKNKEVYCIYVSIGQKRSSIINTVETLKKYGAMEYTTMVVGEASSLPGLKYLAPFAGCAIAEWWMAKGKDVLIVYDDLTTHAQNYRELSLLLRRPPGREAYPGDIFYLHARLLERATCLVGQEGGGSITALPIVETKMGDLGSYIPTNLISITDGQIYLDSKLFSSGFLPAIDISRSVSRIGGKAQLDIIINEVTKIKLDYLQFLELEVFTRFGTKLEASMQEQIHRGRILREIFKQDRLEPKPVEFQRAWLIAYNEGLFEDLNTKQIPEALGLIQKGLEASSLALRDDRQIWADNLKRWLSAITSDHDKTN